MKHIITVVIALAALMAQAQSDFGKWIMHPTFAGSKITNCIDTGDDVYYLASGNLFRYDKETQENEHLNKANYLNDSGVKNIYYNAEKNYIMVAYLNSNIDVIDVSSRSVSNMSDIKEYSYMGSKEINDITFAAGNRAVVATDFGFVIFDDSKLEVTTSFVAGYEMSSAVIMGDYIILNHDSNLLYAPVSKHLQFLTDLSQTKVYLNGAIVPISSDRFFMLDQYQLSLVKISVNGDKLSFGATRIVQEKPLAVNKLREGGYVASFVGTSFHYTLSATGDAAEQHDGAGIYSSLEGGDAMWVLDEQGLKHTKGGVVTDNVKPNAISIAGVPFWMAYDSQAGKLLLSGTADNAVLESLKNQVTELNTYDGVMWTDVTPASLPQPDESGSWPVISPNEDNTYFFSTRKLGVVKVSNDKITAQYTEDNCNGNFRRLVALRFDSQGNLWAVQPRDQETPVVAIRPAAQAKASLAPADLVRNTSTHLRNLYHEGSKRVQFAIGAGDVKVASNGDYQRPVVVWENNADLSLKRSITFASGSLPDQDGKRLDWYDIRSITADNDGMVWMGTTSGMIAFDPRQAFDADFHVTHIKVPRNDGTNLADYLLDGQTINCIAVDGANRKWIGTDGSGLFLVSADGQQVLKNFNASNSVMGSNQIYFVCCDPTSNSVFVTTPLGVAEYKSDATPGEGSFSSIMAYPNPVRPDYGGPINITGLMDNSLVKICDPAGNVIRTLKSTGGMVTWDGCNYNGDLVPTGVYTILASQAQGSSGGGSTKVLIVR